MIVKTNPQGGGQLPPWVDTKNLTTGLKYSFGGVTETISYAYNQSMDNAPATTTFTDNSLSGIYYDSLGRKSTDYILALTGKVLTATYSYVDHATVSNRTSGLVSKIDYDLSSIKDLEYEYDSRGNIVRVNEDDTYDKYTYDSLNRLIRSDSEKNNLFHIFFFIFNIAGITNKQICDCGASHW